MAEKDIKTKDIKTSPGRLIRPGGKSTIRKPKPA